MGDPRQLQFPEEVHNAAVKTPVLLDTHPHRKAPCVEYSKLCLAKPTLKQISYVKEVRHKQVSGSL